MYCIENKIAQFIFNKVGIPKAEKYLDLAALRHKLVSKNISQSSTPGYKAKDIDFQQEYQKLTQTGRHIAGTITNEGHIPTGFHQERDPKINETKITPGDVNSVDVDEEIPKMALNELQYTINATLIQRKFEGLRKVIQSK